MSEFMEAFTHSSPAVRVRFGRGVRFELAEELRRLNCGRALFLSTPAQAERVDAFAQMVGGIAAGLFTGAQMHTPIGVSEEATAYARKVDADCIVAVGGGSTTGLGKAIAYRTDLPQVAVPTTYAGSEATAILGQTSEGRKTTLTDPRVQPEVILYDPELVVSLPAAVTVASAFNAIAHAAEGLYARDRGPVTTLMAREGMTAFRDGLPAVLADPSDLQARGETLYGAWLCGTVLGAVGMALHHKLCHTLGGSFDLPHAQTHAIVLPHAIAYNEPAAPEALAPVAAIFGAASPGLALHGFAKAMGAPLALRDLGLREADLDRAAAIATGNPYWNPRPIEAAPLRALLQRTWEGAPPEP